MAVIGSRVSRVLGHSKLSGFRRQFEFSGLRCSHVGSGFRI